MKIRLRLYADFEEKMPEEMDENGATVLELPEGTLIRDVLDRFEIPYEDAYVILLNGRHAVKETALSAGVELCIFPAVVGG